MKIKQLSKALNKQYWKNCQNLYITSIELMNGDGRQEDGPLSIYSISPNEKDFCKQYQHYLFDVQNYNAFHEVVPTVRKNILYPDTFNYKTTWDVCRASCSTFYNARDRVYTIPKFTNISREDILRCFEHFKSKVLVDSWCLFNHSWYDTEKDDKQYEFDFMYS